MSDNQHKAEVPSIEDLNTDDRKRVFVITEKVKGSWKKTVESLLAVGEGLSQLKELMPYKLYLDHIRQEFGLSEPQAWRLVSVWQKFGGSKSSKVLESKISTLYLLSTAPDLKKVETLAAGGKVLVGGKRKSIDEITVAEATKLKKCSGSMPEPTQSERDRELAETAHRQICTLAESLADWCSDLTRIQKRGLEITNSLMVKDYLREVVLTANSLVKML